MNFVYVANSNSSKEIEPISISNNQEKWDEQEMSDLDIDESDELEHTSLASNQKKCDEQERSDLDLDDSDEDEEMYSIKLKDLHCLQEKLRVITSTFEAALSGKRRKYQFLCSNINRIRRGLRRKFRNDSLELESAWTSIDIRMKRYAQILKDLQKDLEENISSEIKIIVEDLEIMEHTTN
ncbi:MAG TPA: hypothetical protein VJ438_05280 [Candidatus Nanoarchaeia archaeon]|nr:hypothetical protein [Candidatus Nanoarchaeia archaeon]